MLYHTCDIGVCVLRITHLWQELYPALVCFQVSFRLSETCSSWWSLPLKLTLQKIVFLLFWLRVYSCCLQDLVIPFEKQCSFLNSKIHSLKSYNPSCDLNAFLTPLTAIEKKWQLLTLNTHESQALVSSWDQDLFWAQASQKLLTGTQR